LIAPSGAFALVGMAAVFSAAARAPITAIIIVFEMTRNYGIILPLMMAVVVSVFIARRLMPESIYTLKLKRRGVILQQEETVDVLEKVKVEDVMTPNFPVVPPDMSLAELSRIFAGSKHHGFPVIDNAGNIQGMVTIADLEARMTSTNKNLTVADITTTNLITTYPDESLHDVLQRIGASEVGRIPVVDRKNPLKLIGVLRRHDIVKAYIKAQSRMQDR